MMQPGPKLDALVSLAVTGKRSSAPHRLACRYSRSRKLALDALEKWVATDAGRVADLTMRAGLVEVLLELRDETIRMADAPTFAHAVALALAATVEEK